VIPTSLFSGRWIARSFEEEAVPVKRRPFRKTRDRAGSLVMYSELISARETPRNG
jgi:hypothetical protein